jgi:hypothetical protein
MKDGKGIKIAVKFKPELFERINKRATKQRKNFSEIVNDAVSCGLLDLEESERDEPDCRVAN